MIVGIHEEAARLAEEYGDDPQDVGAEDGTEDDFGDLVSDLADFLFGFEPSDSQFSAVEEAATDYEGTTMLGLIEHVASVLGLDP